MNRARVNPIFARQERHHRRGEDDVDPRSLELYVKFREYGPHLKSRLQRILKDGRQNELQEEVEDIKFFISVMTDIQADENHGAEAIQRYIDKIHEMIRKNPLNDMPSSSCASDGGRDEEDDEAPRSPSPDGIELLSEPTSTARTIPLEREASQSGQGKRSEEPAESASTTPSVWDLPAYDNSSTYMRRGSFKDVDMRSDLNCQPISNTRPAGRGSGVISGSYRSPWDPDPVRNDVYNEPNRSSSFSDSRQRDNLYNRSDQRDSSEWGDDVHGWNPRRRRSGFEPDTEYDHRHRSDTRTRDYGHGRGTISSQQDYSIYGGVNHGFDRRSHDQQNRNLEESMFDRRPPQTQFDRREMPPATNRDSSSASVQFDYNHGSGRNNGQTWAEDVPADTDPGANFIFSANPVINHQPFTTSYEIPQQQMFLNHQMGYPANQLGPQSVAGYMPMTSTVPNTHIVGMNSVSGGLHHNPTGINPGANVVPQQVTQVMSTSSGVLQSPGATIPVRLPQNFQIPQPVVNNRPGLLPTPPVAANIAPPNLNNFGFRNPNGIQHSRPPRPAVLTSPNSSASGSSSNTNLSMSEISKQKAQQCFSQGRSQSSMHPRPRIATNQMVSDRDPRLLNRVNPTGSKHSSNGSHTSHPGDTSSSKRSLNDHSDDRRSGSKNSSDRLPRDPRSYQRDDRRDRDRSNRDRDRDRESRDRDRDSRDRNGSNSDPKGRNEKDTGSSSHDPRHKTREDARLDKNSPSDMRQSKTGSSTHNDKSNERNRPSEDAASSSFRRDESKDRSSKGVPEDDASAKRLEEVRNRVRANMVQPKTVKPLVPDRLQEIRKQAAKDGYLTLGGKPVPGQKKQTNFEDAISSNNESSPSKSGQKSGKKDFNKDKESVISGGVATPKKTLSSKNKAKDTNVDTAKEGGKAKRRRINVVESDESDAEKEQQTGKKVGRSKSKSGNSKANRSKAIPEAPPKKTGFRIPKLKRPEPPRVSTPPSPVESATVEDASGSVNPEDTDGLNLETTNLVKAFVRGTVPSSEADNILNDPEALNEVVRKLKEQVKLMYSLGSSTALKSPVESAPDELVEVPSQSPLPDDAADSVEEPGSHRSRSAVRKKNAKRRSSLEKLHDALKEMRFDTMLPLGPRRCTRGPVDDSTNEETTSEKAIPSENREPASVSDPQETVPNTTDLENETESLATTSSGKRGRKRKRKPSVAKVSKKKKGPTTRARVAVKAAVQKITDPKKKADTIGASNSGEGRVTRSRTGTIGRNSILTNIGLGKVKVEADYVAPKEEPPEPDDIFTSETFQVEDGFQDMVDSSASQPDLHAQVAPTSHVHLTMPSFSQDSDDVTGGVESSQTLPGHEHVDFQRRSVNPPVKKSTKRRVKEEQISPNKNPDSSYESSIMEINYEPSDLSFLPDLPPAVRILSLAPNEENDAINTIYSKINSETDESTQSQNASNNSLTSDNLEDRISSTVETQEIEISSQSLSDVSIFPVSMDSCSEDSNPRETKFSHCLPSISKKAEIEVIQIDDSDDDDLEITAHHDYYQTLSSSSSSSSSEISSDDEAVLSDLAKIKGRVHLVNDHEKTLKGDHSLGKTEETSKSTNSKDIIGADRSSETGNASPSVSTNSLNLESSTSVQLTASSQLAGIKTEIDGNLSDECSGTNLVDRGRGDSTKVNLEGSNLYICANEPCRFTAVNGTLFKDHITSCIFTPESKTVRCFHCDKRVKTIPHLLEHIKIHGHQKQFCSLCEFKTSMNSELTRHMKTHHKVYNFKLVSVDRGVDEDPDCIVLPKEVAAKTLTLEQLQESYARHADRLVFGPDDIEKLPLRQIFHTLAHCSLCSYSTKVRVNFCRHLQMHKNGKLNNSGGTTIRDPVNPVPCLERQEMMFDKMTNWAGSSHAPKTVNGAADNTTVPQFVLEQFRYVCSETGCGQITTDEYMLRTHMKTLHPNTEVYSCPHCSKTEHTKNDPRNSVSIDKLGNHLKLHGPKLYRCAHCDFINTLPTPMEKHLPDKHPEKKPIHYLIRNLDANGESATRRSSVEDGLSNDKWRCTVCNSKALFSTYEEAKNHCTLMHRVAGQFVCADCRYSTDSDQLMKDHITKVCEHQSSKEGKIFVMWIRTDYAEVVKPDDTNVQGPIWKRTPQSVKHIRGIFLEESKEKNKATPDANKDTPKESRKSVLKAEQPKDEDMISPFIMKCPKCNIYKTKNKKDMIVHLHNEMSYQRYQCTKCGHKFITENSLKGHVTGDHGIPYNQSLGEMLPEDPEIEAFVSQCLEQDSTIKTDGSTVVDKADNVRTDGNFKCKHCPQEFQSGHNLRTHLLARHLASNMHVCQHCKQGFWNKKLAVSHHERNHKNLGMQIQHDIKLEQTFTPAFWMEEYGITVKEEKKIKKDKDDFLEDSESPVKPKIPLHVYKPKQKPTNRRIVFCAHCEYECDNPTDLENHMATHKVADEVDATTIQKDQTLEVVPETSRDPYDFSGDTISHIRVDGVRSLSTENRRNSQPTAGTSGQYGLMRGDTHTIYKCFHCKDNFLTVRATRTHWQKVHSRRPEERCNYYQFQTTSSAHGTTEKKTYNCFVCEQGTFDFNAVVAHHLTHHKELPFRISNQTTTTKLICEHCKVEFSKLEEIQHHMDEVHQNLPSKYYAMDLHVQDSCDIFDSLGKLIEDSVRFMCMACKCDFSTREEHRDHIASVHAAEKVELTAGLKFQSHTLNSKIQVPGSQVQLNFKNSVKYKCPVCEYVTADKEEMTSEHLTNHLYIYLCPRCPTSFQTLRDAKFHVRHSHGEHKIQPSVNEDAVAAFKLLEDVVEEIQGSDVKAKSIGNQPGPSKRTSTDTTIKNVSVMTPEQMTRSLMKKTTKQDELLADYIIGKGDSQTELSKNPERSVEAGPSSSFVKGRSNSDGKSCFPPVSTSPKPCTSVPGIPLTSAQDDDWMENFVNNNPIAPELIEIPGVGSDQWGNIDIADYSGIAGEDPFMNMNTNWGWEGKN